MAKFELVRIKQAGGDETPRFEAWITCDGATMAQVWNDGNGGCNGYRYATREAEAALTEFGQAWWNASGARAKQVEFFKANGMPEHDGSNPEALDSWVFDEMDSIKLKRALTRASKTKTLFRLAGDPEGSYRSLSGGAYSPASVKWLENKFGDKVESIYLPEVGDFAATTGAAVKVA